MQGQHSNINSSGTIPVAAAESNFTRHSPPNSPPNGRGTSGNNSPSYANNVSNENRYDYFLHLRSSLVFLPFSDGSDYDLGYDLLLIILE